MHFLEREEVFLFMFLQFHAARSTISPSLLLQLVTEADTEKIKQNEAEWEMAGTQLGS